MACTAARAGWIWIGALFAALAWAYAPVLLDLARLWWNIPDYSHGFFVAPTACYLAWRRRNSVPERLRPSAWGLAVVAVALSADGLGTATSIRPLEQYSFVAATAGVVLLIGGGKLLRWAWPMVAFLLFMAPLPHALATALAAPLQRIAAAGAVYLAQAAGVPALAEGTTIEIENAVLEVAFACSGLQMLISFGAVCTAIAMLSNYGPVGRFVVAASAAPIALGCNMIRIALVVWAQWRQLAPPRQLHDAGGVLVVPLTIALVLLGMFLFERCFPRRVSRASGA